MSDREEYQTACDEAVAECRRLGYPPNAFVAMMRQLGADEAAKRLVLSGDFQTGFERLVRMGRLDLTVEFSMLNPRWDSLFGDEPRLREAAYWRLQTAMRQGANA